MSVASFVDTSSFATSRGKPLREDAEAVLRLLGQYPEPAVARMVGRSLDYVRLVRDASRVRVAAPVPSPPPPLQKAIPRPRPVVVRIIRPSFPRQTIFRHWRPSLPPRARLAVLAVAAKYGVSLDVLIAPALKRGDLKLCEVRQEAYHAVREIKGEGGEPAFSLPLIGTWFGGRDHTTILWGLRAHAARLAGEPIPPKHRAPPPSRAIRRQRRAVRELAARLAWREGVSA